MKQTDYLCKNNLMDVDIKNLQKEGWILVSVSNDIEKWHTGDYLMREVYHFVKTETK